jgi:YfiH family protein
MLIIRPFIYLQFQEIICGFNTKVGLDRAAPYYFNLSYSVGDKKEIVDNNRNEFFKKLGLNTGNVSYQKQVHEDSIREVDSAGNCGESDALITTKKNLGLAISSADCPAILIYDPMQKVIAAVHSGWRGTEKQILKKTIQKLNDDFNSDPANLVCYVGPSITQQNYEVSKEVADKFNSEFIKKENDSLFLDLKEANLKMLKDAGIKQTNIQVSNLCSFEYESILHSYRRDGQTSGRALGIIAMRENL